MSHEPTPRPFAPPRFLMWILKSTTHAAQPVTFRVPPGAAKTLGRSVRADFIIDVAMVSRVHCRLTADEAGRLTVEDLESTNGTFVNDRRVSHHPLAEGDVIQVGETHLLYQVDHRRA
jgi:pSer/pThr/pTyr-binding forkhead associated (FHA) protein